MVTDIEMWSVRVSGWGAAVARAVSPLAEIVAVPDGTFDGAALLVSLPGRGAPGGDEALDALRTTLISAGASVRTTALVGSHAARYTVSQAPAPAAP
jgi:hypothetical protein